MGRRVEFVEGFRGFWKRGGKTNLEHADEVVDERHGDREAGCRMGEVARPWLAGCVAV